MLENFKFVTILPSMKNFFILTFYLLRTLLILLKPGGSKTLIAENIMLRKQLITVGRHRKKAPNLSFWDRLHFGFLAGLINPKRLTSLAIIIKPSMLIKFHKAIVKRKYSALFSKSALWV